MNNHEKFESHTEVKTASNRSFGIVFAIVFLIVALVPFIHGHNIRGWAIGVSAIFCLAAIFVPIILAPLNHVWTKFGIFLHLIISPIALSILFYGVFTPLGLLIRMFGKDHLRLRIDRSVQSYWIIRTPPGPDPASLKNQF